MSLRFTPACQALAGFCSLKFSTNNVYAAAQVGLGENVASVYNNKESTGDDGKREGDDIQTRDPFERANVLRKRNKIRVSGTAPPAPMTSFNDIKALFGVSERLMSNLNAGGFDDPTPVQKQSVPALADGRVDGSSSDRKW